MDAVVSVTRRAGLHASAGKSHDQAQLQSRLAQRGEDTPRDVPRSRGFVKTETDPDESHSDAGSEIFHPNRANPTSFGSHSYQLIPSELGFPSVNLSLVSGRWVGSRASDLGNSCGEPNATVVDTSPARCLPSGALSLQWPDSIALNLLIAGAIGFLYTLLVLGLPRLDPTNLSWLDGDPATFYIAWELFRQDPHLHWPLTFTDRVGYPLGDSIAFMDPNPLLLILLKPLSPLLPTPFQYLGIAAVLAAALQFFFGARLFRLLLGRNVSGVLLPSMFFLIAPPMTWRLVGHYRTGKPLASRRRLVPVRLAPEGHWR